MQWTPQLDPAGRQQPGTSTSDRNDSHRMPVPQLEKRHGSQVSLDGSVTDAASSAGDVVCICLGEHCQFLPPRLHDCALHAMHNLRPDTCCISVNVHLCLGGGSSKHAAPCNSSVDSSTMNMGPLLPCCMQNAHSMDCIGSTLWSPADQAGVVALHRDVALAVCRPG